VQGAIKLSDDALAIAMRKGLDRERIFCKTIGFEMNKRIAGVGVVKDW
jgi:hypothetical protein